MSAKEPPSSDEPPRVDDGKVAQHEHETRVATIKTHWLSRWMVALGAIGVVVAIIFGLVSACGPSDPPGGVNVPGSNNTVNVPSGNCNQVSGGTCTVIQQAAQAVQAVKSAEESSNGDDGELKKRLRAEAGASSKPAGAGPWPFVVVDTHELGLFARTTDTVAGTRVGNTANHELVWATCIAQSDFTPADVSGENNVGPKWVQVHWKHQPDGLQRGLSEPTEPQMAWMYRGALEPVGHNGDIPTCSG